MFYLIQNEGNGKNRYQTLSEDFKSLNDACEAAYTLNKEDHVDVIAIIELDPVSGACTPRKNHAQLESVYDEIERESRYEAAHNRSLYVGA